MSTNEDRIAILAEIERLRDSRRAAWLSEIRGGFKITTMRREVVRVTWDDGEVTVTLVSHDGFELGAQTLRGCFAHPDVIARTVAPLL